MASQRFAKPLLLIVASLVALYLCEGFLAVTASRPVALQRQQAAEKAGVEFDRRSKREYVQALRNDGLVVVPHFPPFITLAARLNTAARQESSLFPLAGISSTITVSENENGYYKSFLSDRFGFNNPAKSRIDPIDLVMLGDSFTMGADVRQQDELAGLFRQRGFQPLNLGYSATGPLIQLAALVEYGADSQPDTVVWFFFEGNDLFNLSLERQSPLLMNYLAQPGFRQNLARRQAEIDRFLAEEIRASEQRELQAAAVDDGLAKRLTLSHTRRLIRQVVVRPRSRENYVDNEDDFALFSRIVERVGEIVGTWNGRLLFVYLPEYSRFNSAHRRRRLDRTRTRVLEIVASNGVSSIDVIPTFERESDPRRLFPFALPGHYNPRGYKAVAEAVLGVLTTTKK